MSVTKTKTPRAHVHSAALTRKFLQSIEPVDLAHLFEMLSVLDSSTADAHFESLVQIELAENYNARQMNDDEYLSGCDRIKDALPEDLRKLNFRLREHEESSDQARTDVAFRLGIKIGKALAAGVR